MPGGTVLVCSSTFSTMKIKMEFGRFAVQDFLGLELDIEATAKHILDISPWSHKEQGGDWP